MQSMVSSSCLRVYLVEDHVLMQCRMRRIVEGVKETQVVGVADAENAAVLGIEITRPHVVLLDLHLRSGGGFGVLKAIKQRYPGTVVVIVTALDYPQLRRHYVAAGADGFFNKQEGLDLLVAYLESCRDTLTSSVNA